MFRGDSLCYTSAFGLCLKLQRSFIRELGLSEEEAFLAHHYAPLELRRGISAFCFLHKIQLGEIHTDFMDCLPRLPTKS